MSVDHEGRLRPRDKALQDVETAVRIWPDHHEFRELLAESRDSGVLLRQAWVCGATCEGPRAILPHQSYRDRVPCRGCLDKHPARTPTRRPHHTYIPLLTQTNKVKLTVYSRVYRLTATRPIDRFSPLPRRIELSMASYAQSHLHVGLNNLTRLFPGVSLKYLSVSGKQGPVDTQCWVHLCGAFPILDTLDIANGWGCATHLWIGLRLASASSETGSVNSNSAHSAAFVSPELHTVRLHGSSNVDEKMLDGMLECLRVRAERGTRLQKLETRNKEVDSASNVGIKKEINGLSYDGARCK